MGGVERLDQWLAHLEGIHPQPIDLELSRITEVANRLGLRGVDASIITVAGTNGKGSTVACLEAMLQAGGYQPGAYTSPHLLRFNERIRVSGEAVSDALIVQAFTAIEAARERITLTYFEFATLAAAWCFREQGANPWLLEVGLGGRLDATNCFDADLAIVTPIDLDHMEWLGDNREAIAGEKLGIARPGRPLVCSDPNPPARIADRAAELGAAYWQLGRNYQLTAQTHGGWCWSSSSARYEDLPQPTWLADAAMGNAAGAVMALSGAYPGVQVDEAAIYQGLAQATLMGRQQWVSFDHQRWLLDVGHNPAAIGLLVERLSQLRARDGGVVRLAFALMQRKPLPALIDQLIGVVDEWFVLTLDDPDAHPPAAVQSALDAAGGVVLGCGDASAARAVMNADSMANDLNVAVGSFRVVEAFLRLAPSRLQDAV